LERTPAVDGLLPGKRRWRIGPAAILGTLAVAHFGMATYLWYSYSVSDTGKHRLSAATMPYYLSYAGPCVALLLLSLVAAVLGVMGKRRAWTALFLVVALAVPAFWYDVSHKRYQLDVFIARAEYRERGSLQHVYLTWWCYNDRWFRKGATQAAPGSQPAAQAAMTEAQRVDYLIDTIGKLEDATFIRNDAEHSAATAAALMRYRWDRDKDRIKTAEDFVKELASRSSTTGKLYVIRFKDGTEVKSGEYLTKKLEELGKGAAGG